MGKWIRVVFNNNIYELHSPDQCLQALLTARQGHISANRETMQPFKTIQSDTASNKEKIAALLERHRSRYAHNKIPYETATYLQVVHNPVQRDQFLTVQQVKRLKATDLEYPKGSHGGDESRDTTTAIGVEALLGGQISKQVETVKNNRGKGYYRFQYETLTSSGPKHSKDFTDPDQKLKGRGNGKWVSDNVEPTCIHKVSPNACTCKTTREYLIIAVWTYKQDEIKVLREYTIEDPYIKQDNVQPLYVSRQAKVAYWFERNPANEVVYTEISLVGEPGEPVKMPLRLNEDLPVLLAEPSFSFIFSMDRIVTKEGEPVLVYSRPTQMPTKQVKRPSVLKTQAEEIKKIVKQSSEILLRTETQVIDDARKVVEAQSRAKMVLEQDGVKVGTNEPLAQLKFYSLRSRTLLYKIDNGDCLLDFNAEKERLWVLRVATGANKKSIHDEVVQFAWNKAKPEPQQADQLRCYRSEAKESEIIQYRRVGFKSVEIYFSAQYQKLVLLSGFYIATVYSLSASTSADQAFGTMRKKKVVGLTRQLQICRGEHDSEVYLAQIAIKDKRDMTPENIKRIPDSDDLFELKLFDICNANMDQPLEPQFTLDALFNKDFAFNNRCYQHGLFLDTNLDVCGPLLQGDRSNFGFVQSKIKDSSPMSPQIQSYTTQIKYPCLIYRAPNPSKNKVFVQSLYQPEKVRVLDLGDWKFLCGVENVMRTPEKGQVQPFTALARSPDGALCLILIKVNPFVTELDLAIKWEILGVLESLDGSEIDADSIVIAKLLEGMNNISVIAQYDGELLALKVKKHLLTNAEISERKMKSIANFVLSTTDRNLGTMTHKTRAKALTLDEIDQIQDPFVERQRQFRFGRKLCPSNELLSKRILLSKTGSRVYFFKRDHTSKADQMISVQLIQDRGSETGNDMTIEVQMDKIFELTNSRLIYAGFDHQTEQRRFIGTKDAFYILDSNMKIHRLHESLQVTEVEGGQNFTKEAVYVVSNTVDLEKKLGPKTLSLMNIAKIFNTKWPLFNITMRSIQYKNLTVGFDGDDRVIATLGEEHKATEVMALRGTAYLGGYVKEKTGESIFFAKPNMGSRATDCLGLGGPQPTQVHIVGNGLILYSWKDCESKLETTKMFNSSGRFMGTVLQPRNRQSDDPHERYENLVPIKSSYDSQFFLLARKKGHRWEGAVSRLVKSQNGQYKFDDIAGKLHDLGNTKEVYYQVTTDGQLYTIECDFQDDGVHLSQDVIKGCSSYDASLNWMKTTIELPELPIPDDNPLLQENVADIHIDLTKDFIVLMRRDGTIIKLETSQLFENQSKTLKKLSWSTVKLPIADFYTDPNEVDEIGLKWMYVDNLVQIKLKQCLLHYDIKGEKEVASLNNYRGVFDNWQGYVLTPFFIPVTDPKTGRPTREYIELSHNQTFVLSYDDRLRGRIYNMHDELSLHSLQNIAKKARNSKPIDKIDLTLLQSTFMGNSVFHLCYNNFDIIQCLHKQVCGTVNPGEVGDVILQEDTVYGNGTAQTVPQGKTYFQMPAFRRVVQLLIRKNIDGDSPLNLAIRNRNFRCFELMLSILLNASDVFVSKNFLSDLGNMLEIEAKTVEVFFDKKMVDNAASEAIEKVRWSIDQDSAGIVLASQLFTKDDIEKVTCPQDPEKTFEAESQKKQKDKTFLKPTLQIHSQLIQQDLKASEVNSDAAMKAVEAKLLDIDWVFQDGNGQTFVWMLAMTGHEALFSTKQVTTVIDLLWDQYQTQIFKKVFMPYVIYFSSALIYFTFFLRKVDNNWISISIELALRLLVIANMILFEALELIQLQASGFWDYILDFWNMLDQLSFISNLLTLTLHGLDSDVSVQKIVGATSIFLLYVKFFYWLRLFDGTAAFIRMLREIIIDIIPFLVFLGVCVAMFGNTMLLFDQSRRIDGVQDFIIQEVYGIPWLDSFIRSYMIGLGEFDMDNFGAKDGVLVWTFFLLATFVTQLLFMNLLIAIMGDTFDRVQEMKVQAATKEKISMITDFIWVLDLQAQFQDVKYILIVEQQTIQGDQNVWEGKVGQLKHIMQHQTKQTQAQVKNQFDDMKTYLNTIDSQAKQQGHRMTELYSQVNSIGNAYKKQKRQTAAQLSILENKLDALLSRFDGAQNQSSTAPKPMAAQPRNQHTSVNQNVGRQQELVPRTRDFEPGQRPRNVPAATFTGFDQTRK